VLVLLYSGNWVLGVPLSVLAAMGTQEVYRLAAHTGVGSFRLTGATGAAALVLAGTWQGTFVAFAPWALIIVGTVMITSLILAVVNRRATGGPLGAVSITMTGCLYCGFSLSFVPLTLMFPSTEGWGETVEAPWLGVAVIALPLATTWIGDAVAFFVGTKWGKQKLAPSISPNKTWLGSWSGLVATIAVGVVWYFVTSPYLVGMPINSFLMAGLVGAVLGLSAQVGDLVISVFKREAGVKDTGTIFPGHGGILDRIDSIAFTVPVSYAAITFLAKIQ
jgi:phosphatidate cytidylyltransferase